MATVWPHAYRIDHDRINADGYELSVDHLAEAAPKVQALLQDTIGQAEVQAALAAVMTADFQRDRLSHVLEDDRTAEEWRVGEALAEHHLVEYEHCYFPWPSGRDLRNPGSSGGGVDLIGFHDELGEVRLALGEVKTSRQQTWPPSVVTGRHGLQAQLEGLRENDDRKRWAIKYLALHSVGKPWLQYFRKAWVQYANDPNSVLLCGTLVHLTDPDRRDLKARTAALGDGCSSSTKIRLTAIYIPADGLDHLAGQPVTIETP